LRDARDKAEHERDEAVGKLSKEIQDFKNENVKDLKDELLAGLSKGDKDLEKKILLRV